MNVLSLKDVISIRIRSRCDSWSDQWNRLLMSKMFLVTSLIIGIDYFHDEISCIIPDNAGIDSEFVKSACWITGFYIYPELIHRWKHAGYHGIPKDLSLDGKESDDDLCSTITKYGEVDSNCIQLIREFYLQYQWYPFFVAVIGLCFYLPYLVFRMSNLDMINLKEMLTSGSQTKESIIASHFNCYINPKFVMRIRLFMILVVKVIYIIVNIGSFFMIDITLNGRFRSYGIKWIHWTKLNNTVAHDMRLRGYPKPGNALLPPMGICEVHESSRDIRNTLMNRHKFICEISQNILYQYCFLIIWFLLVISVFVSVVGLFHQLFIYGKTLWVLHRRKGKLYKCELMTIREYQYLQLIKDVDPLMFTQISNDFTKNNNLNNTEPYNSNYKNTGSAASCGQNV